MKLSIVTQENVCPEEVYANMNSTHRCYIVDVPDKCFPKEVIDAYNKMYSREPCPGIVISNVFVCKRDN